MPSGTKENWIWISLEIEKYFRVKKQKNWVFHGRWKWKSRENLRFMRLFVWHRLCAFALQKRLWDLLWTHDTHLRAATQKCQTLKDLIVSSFSLLCVASIFYWNVWGHRRCFLKKAWSHKNPSEARSSVNSEGRPEDSRSRTDFPFHRNAQTQFLLFMEPYSVLRSCGDRQHYRNIKVRHLIY